MKMKTKLITKILAFAGVLMMLFALAIPCFASEETSADDSSDAPYASFYTSYFTVDYNEGDATVSDVIHVNLNHANDTTFEDAYRSYTVKAGRVDTEEFSYFLQSYDIQFPHAVKLVNFSAKDFYVWKAFDEEGADATNSLAMQFDFNADNETTRYAYDVDITYHIVGQENEVRSYSDEFTSDYGEFCLSNVIDGEAYESNVPIYIRTLEITIRFLEADSVHVDVSSTLKSDADSVVIPNPKLEEDSEFANLAYFTRWIATATSGFLDAEIIPGISFGGILTVIIAFSVVLMMLKMFR